VGAAVPLIISLAEAESLGAKFVGGKAYKLSQLITSGYRVPNGFCITTDGYRRFVEHGGLNKRIDMETARKSMEAMRWEEIWDAALRLRTAFLRTPIPDDVTAAILDAFRGMLADSFAVRSSAVGEDSAERSYAGLHESVVGVEGEQALLDAVRIVWASLWSDAALLYRSELGLEPENSAMAVVVQELIAADRSGVSFGRDPREPTADRQVVEAVPGRCQDLVDGAVDPDRWLVRRSNGTIIEWRPGERAGQGQGPLLADLDVDRIHRVLNSIEDKFGWPPDIEWTGRGPDFTVLQARPVTTAASSSEDDPRDWYLSLRPGKSKLAALCERVTEELMPALEAEGRRLANEPIEDLPDERLAAAIDERAATYTRWKAIYWDEFIPFAHGVRQLGTYYNDAVKPDDPYEFISILRHQPMIASARNSALRELAVQLRDHGALHDVLRDLDIEKADFSGDAWAVIEHAASAADGGVEFIERLRGLSASYMDIAFDGEQLDARPDLLLHTIVELAGFDVDTPADVEINRAEPSACEQRLLAAVGPNRQDEALSVIEIARLSWRLRDDDNVLLGRVEKQLLRAANIAVKRLEHAGRLDSDSRISAESAPILSAALRDSHGGYVTIETPNENKPPTKSLDEGEKPRQIVGQPAAPGLATAKARVVRNMEGLSRFSAGEVLICDAIQPTMSHIVPLASGIIERRGGMLIHGAIIARELGIPCVNGVSDSILSIRDNEIVTVDGHLGIVTIGPPEFDLETADFSMGQIVPQM
jgi:pyruvate,water dikinase